MARSIAHKDKGTSTVVLQSGQTLSLPLKFKSPLIQKEMLSERHSPNQLATLVLLETHGIDYLKVVLSGKRKEGQVLREYLSLLHYPEVTGLLSMSLPGVQGTLLIAYVNASETISGRQITSGSTNDKRGERFICISSLGCEKAPSGIVIETHCVTYGTVASATFPSGRVLACSDIVMATNVRHLDSGDTTIKKYISQLQATYPSMYPRTPSAAFLRNLRQEMPEYFLAGGGT